MEVFSPPQRVDRLIKTIVMGFYGVFIVSLWSFSAPAFTDKFRSSVLISLLLIAYFVFRKHKIFVDEDGIVDKRFLKSTRIEWSDVDDLLLCANITVIKSSRTAKTISVFHPLPDNVFHQLQALEGNERLRDTIVARTLPVLQQLWSDRKEPRLYPYPAWPFSALVFSMLPVIVPVIAMMRFDGDPFANSATGYVYLFLPFLILSMYLAYRLGVFSPKLTLIVDDRGIFLKKGRRGFVPWQSIVAVTENPRVLGWGSIAIQCNDGRSIVVPKAIERFCDLALRIKAKVGGEFRVNLNLMMDPKC